MTEIEEITEILRKFRQDRKWEKYHTPGNLAKSIAIEAGELLECYQWDDSWTSNKQLNDEEEAADVFILLLNFCEVRKIDIIAAAKRKIAKNAEKYKPINMED